MKRETYLRWHPSGHAELDRYTLERIHEIALEENNERKFFSFTRIKPEAVRALWELIRDP
jgi:hypothetical protein